MGVLADDKMQKREAHIPQLYTKPRTKTRTKNQKPKPCKNRTPKPRIKNQIQRPKTKTRNQKPKPRTKDPKIISSHNNFCTCTLRQLCRDAYIIMVMWNVAMLWNACELLVCVSTLSFIQSSLHCCQVSFSIIQYYKHTIIGYIIVIFINNNFCCFSHTSKQLKGNLHCVLKYAVLHVCPCIMCVCITCLAYNN